MRSTQAVRILCALLAGAACAPAWGAELPAPVVAPVLRNEPMRTRNVSVR